MKLLSTLTLFIIGIPLVLSSHHQERSDAESGEGNQESLYPPSASIIPIIKPRKDSTICPIDTAQSCSFNSNVDSCCTNSPGFFVQTQFWDAGSQSTGPSDSWTIHGLWVDNCSGSGYPQFCDSNREYSDIRSILENGGATDTLAYMDQYWKDVNGDDNQFWSHEWNKHGTCVSTLDPPCYGSAYVSNQEVVAFFNTTVNLFQTLPTYTWLVNAGIVPSNDATYTLSQLQAVAVANFGFPAVWDCQNGKLNQVWWPFYTQGSLSTGTFIPATASSGSSGSTCPKNGIRWIPKN